MEEESLRLTAFDMAMSVAKAADKAMTVEELIILAMVIEHYVATGKLIKPTD